MKAAVFHAKNDLRLEEVATPHPKPGEVVVQVKACGVCTTDLKILAGESTPRGLPAILGHEVAGVIYEIGEGVRGFKIGQRVAVFPIASCGHCYFCVRGKHSLCLNEFGLAHGADGGFAEYVRIAKESVNLGGLVPIEDSLPFDLAAIAEPLSCCISAFRSASLKKGDWVAIVGSGPMGLMHVLVAKSHGVHTIVVDVLPERLKKAQELGAEHIVDARSTDPLQAVRSLTEVGADLVIGALGDADIIKQYLPLVRNGGIFNIFGGPPKGSSLTIDPRWLHYGEINLTGTFGSSLEDFKTAVRSITSGDIDVRHLISQRLNLDSLLDVVEKVRRHEVLKAVLVF